MRRGGRRETEGLDLKEPISVARLIGRFAVAGVVVLALVSALTALASRRIGTDQAIADAQRVTYTTGKGIIEPLLDPRLMEQDRDALEHLDQSVRGTVLKGSLVRVKLWSQDGVVLYSDESRLIGQQFELEADKLEVFETGEAHAEVSDLGSDENQFETESKLLEVYQQLYTTTGEPVLYEAYFRYSGVAAVGRKLWTQFAPIAIGALVLLQLVQIPLAWSMARRLRAGQVERERLLRHAIDASDNERRRIASDLHDGVVQELTGVSLGLAALGRAEEIPRTQVLEASSAIRNSIKSLRSLLVEIYPPNLYEEGLESAVGDLLSGLAARGVATELTVDLAGGELPRDVTALMYRTAQEALRNVAAHSHAAHVRVDLRFCNDHHVRLSVEDDGRGFSAEQLADRGTEGHVGLRSLADLVADMGGSLEARSLPGQGTTVLVDVPVRGIIRGQAPA
jgi:two-component system, NarL family, sensor kinase